MEIGVNSRLRGSSRGQLMSLTVLLILVLILAELFSFVFIDIQYSNVAQSSALSQSSINLVHSIQRNASLFGSASLNTALSTLSYYEFNASLRKGNFIQNTSNYLVHLITNGTLPNVLAGSAAGNYLSRSMGSLTFNAYNALMVSEFSGAGLQSINETGVAITQDSPYSITVSYVENMNMSIGTLSSEYSLPVNFSVPINNTPDLLYDQQGILHYINFANPFNLTSLVTGTYANSGNTVAYAYGTVYYTTSPSCPSLAAGVPQNTILVSNSVPTANCENSFGGFITNTIPSATPTVPYLIYSSNVILSDYFTSGQATLLYGPQLSTLNIENLRNDVANGDYIASPFLPSYLSRANDTFSASSAGMSNLQGYGRQTSAYNGISSLVSIPNSNLLDGIANSKATVSAWVRTIAPGGMIFSTNDLNNGYQVLVQATTGNAAIWANNGGTLASSKVIDDGTWHNVVAVWGGTDVTLYVDGASVLGPSSSTFSASSENNQIGAQCSGIGSTSCNYWFNGQISNVQVYDSSLAAGQVTQIYARGIEGLPVSNSLVGWWPLNGNSNDYSGQGNTGAATNVIYTLVPSGNYLRDMLMQNYTTNTIAIPGIQSCTNKAACSSNSLPNMFLGYSPLETGSAYQTAHFNGTAFMTGNTALSGSAWTVGMWLMTDNTVPADQYAAGFSGTNGILVANVLGSGLWGVYDGANTLNGITINKNQWYYLAVTRNSYTYNAYTDGVLSNTLAMASIGINALQLGRRQDGTLYFNGSIANLQAYSKTLTSNQISGLFNAGINGAPLPNNDLAAWQPLDGNCYDYSGNSNNCTSQQNVVYPYFSGNYLSPGSPGGVENEWQALGFGTSPP